MLLPKIYKRTSTGKIQEWTVEVEGNQFRTISGQTDGKKVISAWTTCAGKNIGRSNETTPEAQALAEATAKRQKKLDGEYKEKQKDIDTLSFLEPMLAHEYKPDTVLAYENGIYAQPKLDGIRCIVSQDAMLSRLGNPIPACPHILEAFKPVFDDDALIEFDGELYNHDLKDNFDRLVSLVKRQKPDANDLEQARKHMKYYVYDIRDKTKIFSDRTKQLKRIIKELNNPMIVYVPTHHVLGSIDLDNLYDEFLEDGYEGQMIRTDTIYEFKRTTALLKRKELITEEFEVVDVLEGKGNRAGMAGKVVIKLHKPTTEGKETCEANPKGGFEFYKRLLVERDQVIGKKATIEFQNYTPKGSLRFPKMITIRDYE